MKKTGLHALFDGYDVFIIPSKEESTLLYAPLLKKVFRVSDDLGKLIASQGFSLDSKNEGLQQIITAFDDAKNDAIDPELPNPVGTVNLSLELTRDCSLSCLYCHAEAGKNKNMPKKILDAAIKHAFDRSKEINANKLYVSYVAGGEPTFKWRRFKESVEKIKSGEETYGIPSRLSITTNGYFGRTKQKFLCDYFDSINLSFDGMKEIQDKNRPLVKGGSSYDRVIETARYFSDHAKSFSVRSTITQDSVNLMPEIVNFFHEELGTNFDIAFEPSFPLGRAAGSTTIPLQESYVENYIKAMNVGKDLGITVATSANSSFNRIVTSYCGALSLFSFVVTTDGIVTACEGDADGLNYAYGQFDGANFPFDNEKKDRITKITELPKDCLPCFAKYHCAGDCPNTRLIGYDHCTIQQKLVQYNLEQLV